MRVCVYVSTAWRSICLPESSFLFSPSHLCHCRNTQPGLTSAHTHITHAETHMYVYRLSICLSVCQHLSVRLSAHIPIKLIKASHLPSFCLSVCPCVCPSICLLSKRSQMMVVGTFVERGGWWGGFTCTIWLPQLKLYPVLNGKDTKWLQQSSCVKMATDKRCGIESKVSGHLKLFFFKFISLVSFTLKFKDAMQVLTFYTGRPHRSPFMLATQAVIVSQILVCCSNVENVCESKGDID